MGCLQARNTTDEKDTFLNNKAAASDPVLPQISAAEYFNSYKYDEEKVEILSKDPAYMDAMQVLTNKSSRHITIDMYENKLLDDLAITMLARELSTSQECIVLTVQFSQNLNFTDEGLKSLAMAVRELKSLEFFKLYLTSTNTSDTGVKYTLEALNGKLLYTLELGLSHAKIEDISLYFISQTLRSQTKLATFIMGTQTNPTLTEKGFSILFDGIKQVTTCQNLQLKLISKEMKFTDKSFINMATTIEALPAIKKIESCFYECDITDSGLSGFAKHVKNSKSLNSLELNLYKTKATDKGWASFVKNFTFRVSGAAYQTY